MEKEKILSTLNEKLGAEGIKTDGFQRTFNAYINANLPAEGTEPDDAYWKTHVDFLKSLSGHFNHDVAEQVKEQTKNVAPPKEEQTKQGPQPNKEVEEMRKELNELKKKLEEKDSQKAQKRLMEQVEEAMKKKGAVDEYVLRQTLKGANLDAKKSVDDLVKELMVAYDSELSDCRGKGAAPRSGSNAGGSNGKNEASDYFDRKRKKEGWPKKQP